MLDFVIIGGGILGLSTAMQLSAALPGKEMLLLEKEQRLASHQSGRNSGVIHAGVYYAPGSLKSRFCLEGHRATREFCEKHSVPYELRGKLLVATNDMELARMEVLWERNRAAGLAKERLGAAALREREPNVQGLGAIFVPATGIVDYVKVAEVMAAEFETNGGKILTDQEVIGLDERRQEVVVRTRRTEFVTRHLVSCSGLMADRILRMLGHRPAFAICPFRGEYYRLPECRSGIVHHLIYPVPDPSMPFLGIHLTPMIDGTLTVGPNAVLALKREGYRKTDVSIPDMARMLTHRGILRTLTRHLRPGVHELANSLFRGRFLAEVNRYCPSLTKADLLPHPSGVRAQAVSADGRLVEDFLFENTRRTVNVCNAPSPAATAAIPIGGEIVRRVQTMVLAHKT